MKIFKQLIYEACACDVGAKNRSCGSEVGFESKVDQDCEAPGYVENRYYDHCAEPTLPCNLPSVLIA